LLVIDNSGSMGEEQAVLTEAFSAMVRALEGPGVIANYRIGFTTTDNGNPWCTSSSTASVRGGQMQISSCRSRLDGFLSENADGIIDRTTTCLDACPAGLEDIPVLPSVIEEGGEAVARPWLERIDGVRNLPADIAAPDAVACIAPQGISGCGFEQPLEAMYLALTRARTEGQASYGFLRPQASLVIVLLTDEVDCSYNLDHDVIFYPAGRGGRPESLAAFWSDPAATLPTSAICWNAGVSCTGDSCRSANLNEDGLEAATTEDAVLHPVDRYVDFVRAIAAEKQAVDPSLEVRIVAIAGVPPGYDGTLSYSQEGDEAFLASFGVAPGCTSENGEAVPPVREREFAEAFQVGNDPNLYSICGDDFREAFQPVADDLCGYLPIP